MTASQLFPSEDPTPEAGLRETSFRSPPFVLATAGEGSIATEGDPVSEPFDAALQQACERVAPALAGAGAIVAELAHDQTAEESDRTEKEEKTGADESVLPGHTSDNAVADSLKLVLLEPIPDPSLVTPTSFHASVFHSPTPAPDFDGATSSGVDGKAVSSASPRVGWGLGDKFTAPAGQGNAQPLTGQTPSTDRLPWTAGKEAASSEQAPTATSLAPLESQTAPALALRPVELEPRAEAKVVTSLLPGFAPRSETKLHPRPQSLPTQALSPKVFAAHSLPSNSEIHDLAPAADLLASMADESVDGASGSSVAEPMEQGAPAFHSLEHTSANQPALPAQGGHKGILGVLTPRGVTGPAHGPGMEKAVSILQAEPRSRADEGSAFTGADLPSPANDWEKIALSSEANEVRENFDSNLASGVNPHSGRRLVKGDGAVNQLPATHGTPDAYQPVGMESFSHSEQTGAGAGAGRSDTDEVSPVAGKPSLEQSEATQINSRHLGNGDWLPDAALKNSGLGMLELDGPKREEAATIVERITQLVMREATLIKQHASDSMSLLVRPDAQTELVVHLVQRDGQVEAIVRCERGDFGQLNALWPQLQEVLGGQKVRLAPLQESSLSQPASSSAPSGGMDLSQGGRSSNRQPAPGEEPPSDRRSAAPYRSPAEQSSQWRGNSGTRLTSSRPGWETWA